MQIYLSIFKKSKIINYKDNIFLLKLNNFLLLQFIAYLKLYLFLFNSTKLRKLLILSLIKHQLYLLFNVPYASIGFFSTILLNTVPFKWSVSGKKVKKIIYPVLKSPFIYKKAFRHFSVEQYKHQITYSGNFFFFKNFLNIKPTKLELGNSIKTINVKENQNFIIQ